MNFHLKKREPLLCFYSSSLFLEADESSLCWQCPSSPMLSTVANEKRDRYLPITLYCLLFYMFGMEWETSSSLFAGEGSNMGKGKIRVVSFIHPRHSDATEASADLWGLLRRTGSNSRRPKTGWPVRVGAHGGEVTNRVLAQIPRTVSPVSLQTRPVIFLSWNVQLE